MKKNILKKAVAFSLASAMLLAAVGCGQKPAQTESSEAQKELKKITFCLDWTPNTNHTGIFAAQQMGYYEEAGLEVEIVQPPEDGATLMCASGQAQFAVDFQDSLAPSIDGDAPVGVSAVAAVVQHNTSGIISRKGDGITSAKGLEGKRYSTWQSPVEIAMIKECMETEGADFDKLELIPNDITDEPAALAANQTDSVWIFYGWSGVNAELSGVPFDYWDFRSIDPVFDYYTPVIIANNDFLANDPETAKAFIAATKKGYEYAIENPKEAADCLIAGDTTGSLQGSEELVYASQEYLSKEYAKDAAAWGEIDPARWDAFYTWLYEKGLTTNDLTGKGYTTEYLPQ